MSDINQIKEALLSEAADLIEELKADNERLREALDKHHHCSYFLGLTRADFVSEYNGGICWTCQQTINYCTQATDTVERPVDNAGERE